MGVDSVVEILEQDRTDAVPADEEGQTAPSSGAMEAEETVPSDDVDRELANRRERAKAAESDAVREARIKNISERFDSNVDYTTVLDGFEGPLDLLLYLIDKEEIEIKDIFISQVTEQFLAYMRGLPYLDVDKVTEYLNIAATILRIKAQSLVPVLGQMADYWDDTDVEEDKQELIRAIEEYRRIKGEVDELKKRETLGYYFREPDREIGATKTIYSLDDLTLEQEQEIRFMELFTQDSSRSEIVTTFQALLELLKYQYLRIRQPEPFGEIYISFNSESSHVWAGEEIDEYE